MNRRKFLGLVGAGAAAAPVVVKSASKPKSAKRGYGATTTNPKARVEIETDQNTFTYNHGVSNREDLKQLCEIKESHPAVFDEKAFNELLKEEFKSLSEDGKTVQVWQLFGN